MGQELLIYPDAEDYIQRQLFKTRIAQRVAEIRQASCTHPLRNTLLNTELLPYQLDGIAFAVGAGRAILADDMGLGKTLQGIGVAELFQREVNIQKVLVISPASLKSQWCNEITRFSNRSVQLVVGNALERVNQYRNTCFFTLTNYEQILRDLAVVKSVDWGLIILDEGQRIKNWAAKTSQAIKELKSPFALVLTGTPIENRLDDLYSIMEFIDDRQLGPGFRFYHQHRVMDEKGKVIGYKNLTQLRKALAPVLLRRTRQSVLQDLPPRTTEIIRIAPTQAQLDMHAGFSQTVQRIIGKKYLTEMDLLRLQKALLMCRMSANGTSLVDKQLPGHSSKLERLAELIEQIAGEAQRKVVLFSEWTSMLDLIEPLLKKNNLEFVRLDGKVPQKARQKLVNRFQQDKQCKFFLTSNAGSTGLNLQAADTVINVDLPWNPALLEQRIARAHRMGQKNPVQVYLLVTEQTLEENLLVTLSAKNELTLAVLDPDTAIDQVDLVSGIEELKRRLETLLGAKPEIPIQQNQSALTHSQQEQKEKLAKAGGQLFSAAFEFMNQLLPVSESSTTQTKATQRMADQFMLRLSQCMEKTATGELQLTICLPNTDALQIMANSMAKLLAPAMEQ